MATRAGAGLYRIAFNTDITNCVYLATGGQDAGSLLEDYHLYEFPGRCHFPGQAGWEDVADFALAWASEHATPRVKN